MFNDESVKIFKNKLWLVITFISIVTSILIFYHSLQFKLEYLDQKTKDLQKEIEELKEKSTNLELELHHLKLKVEKR